MITRGLVEKARLHVHRFFSKYIPAQMRYHDLEHTLTVTRTAKDIGRASGLAGAELLRVELAALFHDTGYAFAYNGHEAESVKLATAWLKGKGAGPADIKAVASLVMATRRGIVPRGLAQRVLRDADSAKAGQADFHEKGGCLRAELETYTGKRIAASAWQRENIAYLKAHRFHTAYARERFGRQKEINLRQLLDRMAGSPKPLGTVAPLPEPFIDRDISWLAFNARVLQEAQDPSVPLLERLKFVAIHSSNLDEFYRVRVAQLRGLRKLGKRNRSALGVPPGKHVAHINKLALQQQAELGSTYRGELIPALRGHGIRIRNERQLSRGQRNFALEHFRKKVAPLLRVVTVREPNAIFIEDRKLYLVLSLSQKTSRKKRLVVVNVPSAELGRFLTLPSRKGTDLTYLDDVIRIGALGYFKGWEVGACHAIKLSRDADLYLEEEFAEDVAEKVRRSLRKRSTGVPARFLYDGAMPQDMLDQLRHLLNVKKGDTLEGGRYHNLSDLMDLPISGHPELREKPLPPIHQPILSGNDPFGALTKRDLLLHFPYHAFAPVIDLLSRSAKDADVRRIAITLYRVAPESLICQALAEAARNGKTVEVVMEVQARFDEGNNLHWGAVLKEAGARVTYGLPGFKVHSKLLLIERVEGRRLKRYAYLGTGNFNEQTARMYADMAVLTARTAITADVAAIFSDLIQAKPPGHTKHITTSPDHLRAFLEHSIDREIEQAFLGRPAEIFLKLNSLEDKPLIGKLYDADRAGVKVRLIVRGICCLMTVVPGHSGHIKAISIVDRYLEHARAYVFHNAGNPVVYLSSADWMERNMDWRVEAAFPVLDNILKAEVLRFMELQWSDNVKARTIDREQTNPYRERKSNARAVRSQAAWYALLKRAASKRS